MTPRERRIQSDYERLQKEFSVHPNIKIISIGDIMPPERYTVRYQDVKGIVLNGKSTPEEKVVDYIYTHEAEIYLHNDYPKYKPLCYMKTEIFHPNIRKSKPNDICIGDYWAPGESLSDIIYLIGEMIMFQNYNINSPLNGIAAKWARENIDKFPLSNLNLHLAEPEIEFKI